eukprot:TRINITY_DN6111_c0_g1_i1.p1 TRINITY_DN6111_c0_g1~~TRINITY_DN6111_c0_g1_i1.p1  ORF type:complete len:213 (+),score=42.52 TRINITY_DN6111_c0_g1_i1:82-639(+)
MSEPNSPASSPKNSVEYSLVVENVSRCVAFMASKNADLVHAPGDMGAEFASSEVPAVTLYDYMCRGVFMKLKESTKVWKAAYVLIKRFWSKAPKMVTPLTVHRVVLCGYMVAMKCTSDLIFPNKYVAKYGGVALANLNVMERHFLSVLDWDVFISKEEYSKLCTPLPLSTTASRRLTAAVLYARA